MLTHSFSQSFMHEIHLLVHEWVVMWTLNQDYVSCIYELTYYYCKQQLNLSFFVIHSFIRSFLSSLFLLWFFFLTESSAKVMKRYVPLLTFVQLLSLVFRSGMDWSWYLRTDFSLYFLEHYPFCLLLLLPLLNYL